MKVNEVNLQIEVLGGASERMTSPSRSLCGSSLLYQTKSSGDELDKTMKLMTTANKNLDSYFETLFCFLFCHLNCSYLLTYLLVMALDNE